MSTYPWTSPPGPRVLRFVLFISGFIVKSRGLKIVGGIALGPVVAALLLLVIAVGMGERRSKGLPRSSNKNSSLLRRAKSPACGSCQRNE